MNPNQKEKLSCEERAERKIKLQAEQEKLRVEEEAAIAMEEKRKLGAAKQRVETVLVEILGPDGHVGRCRIPTAVVVQLGLFRILLGSSGAPSGIDDVQSKDFWPNAGSSNGYTYDHRVDQINGGDQNATHTTGFGKKVDFWYQ